MDRLELAYEEFAADIKRIEHLVELVKSIRKFGATSPEEAGGNDANVWEEAQVLWRQSKERRTDLPIVSGSLLMYMAGRFEFFVRQLVEVTAEEMASGVDSYGNLPDKFRVHLKSQTLEVVQNPRRYGYDDVVADGYLKDFARLLDGNYHATMVSATLLSLTDANLKSRMLTDITKRLGLENIWKDLGKQAFLKIALDTATDGETTAEAQSRLDAVMDERNSLAHPTSDMTFPDPEKVMETAKFLSALSQALRDLFRVYLAQWDAKSAI